MGDRLVERDGELAGVDALIGATAAGDGGLLYLEGPAGIGKSALVGALVERARARGFTVLTARGGELERDFGHGVVRQLFERRLHAAPTDRREAMLAGAARLAGPLFDLGDPTRVDEQSMLHGLYWLCANLAAEAPVLVVVDDAHWADQASLRFLAYLGRRVAGSSILVAVAARAAEPDADRLLLDSIAAAAVLRLSPAPLSRAGVRAVVDAADASAEFTAACHDVTGGNPFLLRELLIAVAAEGLRADAGGARRLRTLGPPSVSAAVRHRLHRLPPAATRLARAVAVLGTAAELRHAAELAGVGTDTAARLADALADAHILAAARPLDFVHPILRRAVYSDIAVGERAIAHRTAANVLLAEGATADSVAPHLLAIDPAGDPGVVDILRAAADRAARNGAPDTAAGYLRRALAEPAGAALRPVLLRELGRAEINATDPVGVERLQQALAATADADERAAIARELGIGLVAPGRYAEAIDALTLAIEEAGGRDPELDLQLTAELTTIANLLPAGRPVATRYAARMPPDLAGDTPAERVALASLAMQTVIDRGRSTRVAELAGRAVDRGLIADQTTDYPIVYDALGALWLTDAVDTAERAFAQALDDARTRGSVLAYARTSCFRSQLRYRLGALADAEADARACLDAAGDAGFPIVRMGQASLIEVLVERDRLDEGERVLRAYGQSDDIPHTLMYDFLLAARGRLRLAEGCIREGVDDLLELRRREREAWPGRCPAVFPAAELAIGLAGLGRPDEARRLADEELAAARRWGGTWSLGGALRAAGLLAGGAAGVQMLAKAVDVLDGSPFRLELAGALTDLGGALRRIGRRTAARQPLARGLDQAGRCGATALVDRAAAELAAAGARPRRQRHSGPSALTASELRVARMAADGMTNAEIAQALFVTLRNVELHLTHVYQKLGIGSRSDLVGALSESLRSAP